MDTAIRGISARDVMTDMDLSRLIYGVEPRMGLASLPLLKKACAWAGLTPPGAWEWLLQNG
jgi:hypothetical protein